MLVCVCISMSGGIGKEREMMVGDWEKGGVDDWWKEREAMVGDWWLMSSISMSIVDGVFTTRRRILLVWSCLGNRFSFFFFFFFSFCSCLPCDCCAVQWSGVLWFSSSLLFFSSSPHTQTFSKIIDIQVQYWRRSQDRRSSSRTQNSTSLDATL